MNEGQNEVWIELHLGSITSLESKGLHSMTQWGNLPYSMYPYSGPYVNHAKLIKILLSCILQLCNKVNLAIKLFLSHAFTNLY